MVKFCKEKYPLGSWKGQKSDGKFMDGWLYNNLELLADKIVDDMTFLGIIYSSTLEVGTGKSVLATQIGEAWTEMINKKHGTDLDFSVDNIVWKPSDLIDKATGNKGFKKLPKYSYVLLDEWEDANYWSELGVTLRQFFRKCRQLNLFIMCIIPNWFQLPLSYAVSRSIFAIDVRFNDRLDRGFFAFYNFPTKRYLYINGKRGHNYRITNPTFEGRFPDGYGVDEDEYRKQKLQDLIEYEKQNPEKITRTQIEKAKSTEIYYKIKDFFPDMLDEDIAKMLKVSKRTITRWKSGSVDDGQETKDNYNIKPIKKKEIVVDENGLEQSEKEKGIYDGEEV